MPTVLVVYDSKTGNTEKMALKIAEGAKQVGVNVIMKRVEQAKIEDLLRADGIVFGSPTYYGQMSASMKALIDKSVEVHGQLEGKVGAAFTSSGGTATGAETTLLSILEAMLVHGMIVQGDPHNKHYGAAAVGPPSDKERRSCNKLGERAARLVIKLKK
ncbi:MAG: NAD(P)H-dependent oxidoreductase [Candidatus Bathyarchaeota archaeon]|nr:MAG: NAD(P)H-dependent oxidoreductase [Candidatus Bathyarchaeota archaeon]